MLLIWFHIIYSKLFFEEDGNTADYGTGNIIPHSFFSGEFDKGNFDVLKTHFERQSRLNRDNTAFFGAGH